MMSSKTLILLGIIFPMIVFQSCSYAPDGTFINPANENIGPPEIQVLKLNIDTDTLYLYRHKKVVFEFSSSNEYQNVSRVHFFIEGILDCDLNAQNGEFFFEWGNIQDGNYELKLALYTHTGTNSIADKIGAESFLFTKSWIVVVDHSYYSQINSESVDGYLNIQWPRYKNSDLIEYIVYRGFDYYSKKEIGRTRSCEFTDSAYVGESARFFVEVAIVDEDQLPWGSLELTYELPDLSLRITD